MTYTSSSSSTYHHVIPPLFPAHPPHPLPPISPANVTTIPPSRQVPQQPQLSLNLQPLIPNFNLLNQNNPFSIYSDARTHGYQGLESRYVRLGRVTPHGGGAGGGSIAKSEDGGRCVVTGKESLRILRISDSPQTSNPDHKYAIGRGGHRIDASRNFWEGSGLKMDSASTDVAWGHGLFSNKILTSARNGELILWDLNKSGSTKYERRTKDHIRSIHKMSVSSVVHHYCITGSADGHMRVWDIRDLSKSIMRVHHPTSVRSLVFSPSLWQPLQAIVGLDNGSIYRWDLKMGQRGLLDRLPVAHTASVTALDWCSSSITSQTASSDTSGLGWFVSGGLDRTVKVWDLTAPGSTSHIPHKPTYMLHPSFAVRRLAWRPGYECEIAVVSNNEYATAVPAADIQQSHPHAGQMSGLLTRVGSGLGLDSLLRGTNETLYGAKGKLSGSVSTSAEGKNASAVLQMGDAVEVWDIRRGWIAKWSVTGSATEGGVTDIAFRDSHALWTQHTSGTFVQLDLRECTKPIDPIPRVATTWNATGTMAFVVDKKEKWEVPYDDTFPDIGGSTDHSLARPPPKALGDPPATITTQSLGTYIYNHSNSPSSSYDLETFIALARRYIFEGADRMEICAFNAGVAFSVGHHMAGQAWLLLGAALTSYIPQFPPTPPEERTPVLTSKERGKDREREKLFPSPVMPQANLSDTSSHMGTPMSAGGNGAVGAYSFPPRLSSNSTTVSTPLETSTSFTKISPARKSTNGSVNPSMDKSFISASGSGSTSLRSTAHKLAPAPQGISKLTPTPTSSASPSPRHGTSALPPMNMNMNVGSLATRRASFFGRPESGLALESVETNEGGTVASGGLPGSLMLLRRPSLSVASPTGTSHGSRGYGSSYMASSPGTGDRSMSSLRHVGEGVLDDSDESESGDDGEGGDPGSGDEASADGDRDEDGEESGEVTAGAGRRRGRVGESESESESTGSGSGSSGSQEGEENRDMEKAGENMRNREKRLTSIGQQQRPGRGRMQRAATMPAAASGRAGSISTPSPLGRGGFRVWKSVGSSEDENAGSDHIERGRARGSEWGYFGQDNENADHDEEDEESASPMSSSDGENGDSNVSSSSEKYAQSVAVIGQPSAVSANMRSSGTMGQIGQGHQRRKSSSGFIGKGGGMSKLKTRSRSSTVASLAASAITGGSYNQGHRRIARQDSKGSVKTIRELEKDREVRGLTLPHVREYEINKDMDRDIDAGSVRSKLSTRRDVEDLIGGMTANAGGSWQGPGHGRQKSLGAAVGIGTSIGSTGDVVWDEEREREREERETERRNHQERDREREKSDRAFEVIQSEDLVFRSATLSALSAAFEEFADEGDVQTCALLALVAAKELGIKKKRVMRFVDSYIEILSRLRLHTCAAYLRKFCDMEEIQKSTLLNTTIYTSCGKCRKPLLVPAGGHQGKALNRGAYAYCIGCDVSVVRCCICRLPVRALLFQCSICHHGGHQACYRQYYMEQPMVDLPSMFLPPPSPGAFGNTDFSHKARGKRVSNATNMKEEENDNEEDSNSTVSANSTAAWVSAMPKGLSVGMRMRGLVGHPCAAGCGHFCWAANIRDGESEEGD